MPHVNNKDTDQPALWTIVSDDMSMMHQLQIYKMAVINLVLNIIETRHEKTCIRGLGPGKTQTGLLSYRD